MQSSMKRPQVRAVNTMQAYFSTPALPPTGVEVSLNPPAETTTGQNSHLSTRQGAHSGPCFSTSGNYNTNEKSVNQRLTRGQQDGFVNYRTACLCRAQRRQGFRGVMRMRERREEGGQIRPL